MNEIFSDQGIEEIRQRLGLGNQSVSEEDLGLDSSVEDDGIVVVVADQNQSIAIPPPAMINPRFVTQQDGAARQSNPTQSEGSLGINFPQNITIPGSLITYRVGPDGATVADIIVQFNDVDGASDYSVKYVSLS
jgi:hypothetical protein